jgi:hypothetical protein
LIGLIRLIPKFNYTPKLPIILPLTQILIHSLFISFYLFFYHYYYFFPSSIFSVNKIIIIIKIDQKLGYDTQNAEDPVLFRSQWGSLLGNISSNAAADTSRLADGRTSHTSSIDIYGMAQCTRNLTGDECLRRLWSIIGYIAQLSSKSLASWVYALSCSIRYEIYSFFSLSMLSPPPPSVQLNSTATATKDSTSNDGNILALILYEFLCWWIRKNFIVDTGLSTTVFWAIWGD